MRRRLKDGPSSPQERRALLAWGLALLLVPAAILVAQNTPLTPIGRLQGRTDANGNLYVKGNVATGVQSGLHPIANLQGTTDSSGNLNVTLASGTGTFGDGTCAAPSITFANALTRGFFNDTSDTAIGVCVGSAQQGYWSSAQLDLFGNLAFGSGGDVVLARKAAGKVGISTGAALLTAGADVTVTNTGDFTRQRYQATITPATGGAGNCGAAFAAAALTADCTVATLPAGMKLVAIYADVTVGFTCSATCTGTKVVQAGTAAGGTQVLAASLNVAVTATYGLADADLGSGMVRASAIQGGLIGSWSATTPISARFTSGTGNWGTGAATNVNAGSVTFVLITEQVK